ncbi:MAG: heparinase II/III family protein [Candidatus Krumholzibacteriota bacterium]|nr:heparinase II/III family protein [Candidatus Krumholzibacteriota bacterium]
MPDCTRLRRILARTTFLLLLLWPAASLADLNPHPRIWLDAERLQRIRTHHWQAGSYEWDKLMDCAARTDMDGAKAQALVYIVTGNESWAQTCIDNCLQEMAANPVMTVTGNTVGRKFNYWATIFDWLYHSPNFTPALKQSFIDYVSQVPADGAGRWDQYPDLAYFNIVSKVIWGPPLWGYATFEENPLAQDYIDNGYYHRWCYVRNALGYGAPNIAVILGGCLPQGMDYGSGTIIHYMRYVDAVLTATGEDLFLEAPALRHYLEYFAKSYIHTEDFFRHPEHGHNAHKGDGYLPSASAAALVAMNRWRDTEEAHWAQWWFQSVGDGYRWPSVDYRNFAVDDVIFSDPTIPAETPAGEPLTYHATGNGMLICRSNWTAGTTEPTTYTTFRAGNWIYFNQNEWDQGNFCLYSHGEDLLVDSGIYSGEGGWGWWDVNYLNQTVAHNSILVKDPQQALGWNSLHFEESGYQNSGGQNNPWRETYPDAVVDGVPKDPSVPCYQGGYVHDASDILRIADNERYTYAFADLTNAYANERWETEYEPAKLAAVNYRPKVRNVTRHWLYLRAPAGGDQEYIITFDRVESTDATFQKKNVLHFIGEPVFPGGDLEDTEVAGHIETWDASRFQMNLGEAVLHGSIVLPAGASVRKVGGVGYEYWVGNENFDYFTETHNDLGGNWRIEIMPPTAREADLFLNVLHPDWAGSPAPTVTRIPSGNFEGASFDGWVTMFAKSEAWQNQVGYAVAMGGTQRHLIFDMEPGYQYRVYRDGDASPIAQVLAGPDGLVEFASPGGGSFQVTQGDFVPDVTPPTGSITILGPDCRASRSATLTLQAEDGESGMTGGQMRLSNDGVAWANPVPYQQSLAWTLPSGDGPKTVYVRYADVMGNWMDTPASDTVTLDQTPPAALFDIVEPAVAGTFVTLECSAEDAGCAGGATVSFSNDGVAWSPPQAVPGGTLDWDLEAQGEGVYTVWARFADALGNVTSPPLSDTVMLELSDEDVAPPELYQFRPTDGATGVALSPTVAFMVADLAAGVDTTSIELILNGEPLAVWILPFDAGRFMVRGLLDGQLEPETSYVAVARAADLADAHNEGEASWSFTTGTSQGQDTQAPSPPAGLTAEVDTERAVVVDWDPSPEPDVVAYQVSYGPWPLGGACTTFAFQTQIGKLVEDLDEGDYWFGVTALDGSGNFSALSVVAEPVTVGPEGQDTPDDPDGPRDQGTISPPGVVIGSERVPLTVSALGRDWTVRLFTVSGRLVLEYTARTEGEEWTWDLLNDHGREVARGLYLVRVHDAQGSLVNEGYYVFR